jgi:hypothetical protein
MLRRLCGLCVSTPCGLPGPDPCGLPGSAASRPRRASAPGGGAGRPALVFKVFAALVLHNGNGFWGFCRQPGAKLARFACGSAPRFGAGRAQDFARRVDLCKLLNHAKCSAPRLPMGNGLRHCIGALHCQICAPSRLVAICQPRIGARQQLFPNIIRHGRRVTICSKAHDSPFADGGTRLEIVRFGIVAAQKRAICNQDPLPKDHVACSFERGFARFVRLLVFLYVCNRHRSKNLPRSLRPRAGSYLRG